MAIKVLVVDDSSFFRRRVSEIINAESRLEVIDVAVNGKEHDGAKATLDALDAGALDFLPKKFEDIARNRDEAVSLLQQRVIQIASKRAFMRRPVASSTPVQERPQSYQQITLIPLYLSSTCLRHLQPLLLAA